MARFAALLASLLLSVSAGGLGPPAYSDPEDAPPRVLAAAPAPVEESSELEIVFTGDVNLGARVGDAIRANGPDWVWSSVRPVLESADLAVVNLECAITTGGNAQVKEFTFRGDPSSLPAMRDAGVDIAGLANNHAADFGRDALVETVAHLRDAGISPVGAGSDISKAWEPLVVERNGVKVGFLSVTRIMPHNFAAGPGLAGVASAYDRARLQKAIRTLDPVVDHVIVLIHWGVETTTAPVAYQSELADLMISSGADLIVGHHPHRLQPVETVGRALVAWSLGNFVFTSPSAAGADSAILKVTLDRESIVSHEMIDVTIGAGGRPALDQRLNASSSATNSGI